jgi:hypothetical protein
MDAMKKHPEEFWRELDGIARSGEHGSLFRSLDKLAARRASTCPRCKSQVEKAADKCAKCGCPLKKKGFDAKKVEESLQIKSKAAELEQSPHSDDSLSAGETGGEAAVNEDLAEGMDTNMGKHSGVLSSVRQGVSRVAGALPDYKKLPVEYKNVVAGALLLSGGYGTYKVKKWLGKNPEQHAGGHPRGVYQPRWSLPKHASVGRRKILNIRAPRKLSTKFLPARKRTAAQALGEVMAASSRITGRSLAR